jgi:sterol desaturase/sphingolipid hydroxylase (fatty acid hydroxylase superfamily)
MTLNDYDPADQAGKWLGSLSGVLTEPVSPFWWPTLLAAAVGAVIFAWLAGVRLAELPRQLFPHSRAAMLRELPVDIACFIAGSAVPFLLGPLLFLFGLAGASVGAIMLIPITGAPLPAGQAPAPGAVMLFFAAIAAFVAGDFMLYWSHRIFHRWPLLWRAHRLHHAPPVLTPITAFRFWPQETLVHLMASAFGQGFALGLCSSLAGTVVSPLTLLGVNVASLVWNLGFAQLRHSHVPLPFPRWLSHVLVSPQMHQVHHSTDPAHHDRNFGTAFAVWDWMFGTLYLPRPEERFTFGLTPPDASAGG